MPKRPTLEVSTRQRYWLDHLVACGKSGRRLSEYASIHRLDLQQLYNWRRQLTGRGLLPVPSSRAREPRGRAIPGRHRSSGAGRAPVRFTAVRLAGGEGPNSTLRIRFPNGIIVEGTGPASPDRDLLSYLAGLP